MIEWHLWREGSGIEGDRAAYNAIRNYLNAISAGGGSERMNTLRYNVGGVEVVLDQKQNVLSSSVTPSCRKYVIDIGIEVSGGDDSTRLKLMGDIKEIGLGFKGMDDEEDELF